MYTINDISNDFLRNELEECLEQCRNCDCLVRVREVAVNANGEQQLFTVNETSFDVTVVFNINQNFYYIRLDTAEKTEFKRVLSYRDIVLERGTQRFFEGRTNDYCLVLDLVKSNERENLVYMMSFFDPIFITEEDDGLIVVCALDNMHFGKDNVNMVEVINEVEYAQEVERIISEESSGNDNSVYGENDEFINNDALLSNDSDYID